MKVLLRSHLHALSLYDTHSYFWATTTSLSRYLCLVQERLPSVQVRPDWRVIEEMDFPRLLKLNLPGVGSGEDIDKHQYGTLHFYDKVWISEFSFWFAIFHIGSITFNSHSMVISSILHFADYWSCFCENSCNFAKMWRQLLQCYHNGGPCYRRTSPTRNWKCIRDWYYLSHAHDCSEIGMFQFFLYFLVA